MIIIIRAITLIFINISENRFVIRYGLDKLDLLRKDENLCFATREEAQKECDERNGCK